MTYRSLRRIALTAGEAYKVRIYAPIYGACRLDFLDKEAPKNPENAENKGESHA